jgi:hypothetical protein
MDFSRDQYRLGHEGNVYFVPTEWPTQNDEEDGEEVLCYYPTRTYPNSEVETRNGENYAPRPVRVPGGN